MSASKPTSGPWAVFDHGFKKTGAYVKREGASFAEGAIAIIPRSTTKPFRANAQLVAAAPDLLEALASITENAEIRGYVQLTKTGNPLRETMRKARAALTKATGAQP